MMMSLIFAACADLIHERNFCTGKYGSVSNALLRESDPKRGELRLIVFLLSAKEMRLQKGRDF
jgi:hypothetical protein